MNSLQYTEFILMKIVDNYYKNKSGTPYYDLESDISELFEKGSYANEHGIVIKLSTCDKNLITPLLEKTCKPYILDAMVKGIEPRKKRDTGAEMAELMKKYQEILKEQSDREAVLSPLTGNKPDQIIQDEWFTNIDYQRRHREKSEKYTFSDRAMPPLFPTPRKMTDD